MNLTEWLIVAIVIILVCIVIVYMVTQRKNLEGSNGMSNMNRANFDEMVKKLRLSAKAINRLRQGHPKPDAVPEDDPNESHILHYLEEIYYLPFRKDCLQLCRGLMSRLGTAYSEFIEFFKRDTEDDIKNKIRQDYDHALKNKENIIREKYKEKQRKERDYTAFCLKHQLDEREPRYPDSMIFHWSIVGLLFLGESMANSYFFAQGTDFGLLGGFFQAVLVSAVNVGVALLFGQYALRYFWHYQKTWKYLAGGMLLLYVIFAIGFNLLVAYYRVALEIDPDNAARIAFSLIWPNPFAIGNFDAAILLFIGIIISVLALIKSLTSDDPYPGFGATHRRQENARKKYDHLWERLNGELDGLLEQERLELLSACRDARTHIESYRESYELLKQKLSQFKDEINGLGDLFCRLIRFYRQQIQTHYQQFGIDTLPEYCNQEPARPKWFGNLLSEGETKRVREFEKTKKEIDSKASKIQAIETRMHAKINEMKKELRKQLEDFKKSIEINNTQQAEQQQAETLRGTR